MLVKICGIRSVEAAQVALSSGADLIGMIMVPNRKRTVTSEQARAIADTVRKYRLGLASPEDVAAYGKNGKLEDKTQYIVKSLTNGPKVVGVFQNQSLEEILDAVHDFGLDIVQLHGGEDIDLPEKIPVPVIRRFTPGEERFSEWNRKDSHDIVLIDSAAGGTGEQVDWHSLGQIQESGGQFILAGGLTPQNVADAVSVPGVLGVDVSGGVETDGNKDLDKIRLFIKTAKGEN